MESGPANAADIASAYDRWAMTYDSDPNKTREMAASALRQSGLALAGREVLEIGCGTGYNTQWLAEQAAKVVALDFSAGMLRQAKTRVPAHNVRLIEHDIRAAWPLPAAGADVAIVMLVLEHIENVSAVFAEAARTLRPGGDFFICELHPTRQLSGRQAEFKDTETGRQVRVPAYLHDISEFINAGLRAGFELMHLGELRDPHALQIDLPRVLTLHLRLRES
jgi:ubiquinone/menaquinone biosynthesis C-methylase UbiE